MKKTHLTTLLGACALLAAGTVNLQGADISFNGADTGNNLFSDADNWINTDTSTTPYTPVAGDDLIDFFSGSTSAGNRAQVDSSTLIGANRLGIVSIKQLTGGAGTAYVEVLNGGTLEGNSIQIGQDNFSTRLGDVIVRTGGTLHGGNGANGGFLRLSNQTGNLLTIEDGATYSGTRLEAKANSVLEVQSGASAISTFSATSTLDASVLDGLFRLDLNALDTTGSYTLLDTNNTITGSLITWLDASSTPGTRSGTGNIADTSFEIENADAGLNWSLTTANSGEDLVFNVTAIPEPSSASLLGAAALALALALVGQRCRR